MIRALLLIHRYVGIVTCVLFTLWFGSGMVMMYVGFPQLTAAERFHTLPPLDLHTAHVLPAQALAAAGIEGWPRALHLEMVLGRPAYRVHAWEDSRVTVFADDGSVLHGTDPAQAMLAVQHLASATSARYLGKIERDQWTVPNSLNAYRPFHHIAFGDSAGTEVYVSDRTGAIVRDTTRYERFWNWCGSVLHWVYFTELRKDRALWRQVVLWIAGVGMVVVFTGIVVGLLRWRPRTRYRSGKTSPYHGMMRWHHVLGLIAAVPLWTWIMSGWLSMEPGQWFSERDLERSMYERYVGIDQTHTPFTIPPAVAWQATPMTPPAREARLRFWQGQPLYIFAATPETTLLVQGANRPTVRTLGGPETVVQAARQLLPNARLTGADMLHAYDFYWYAHHEPRPLPILRVTFDDPHATWFHIDPTTGDVSLHLDASQRLFRIMFNALHSLDFPWLLAARPLWDVVVLSLAGLGLTLSLTAVVIAWRRLRLAPAGPGKMAK